MSELGVIYGRCPDCKLWDPVEECCTGCWFEPREKCESCGSVDIGDEGCKRVCVDCGAEFKPHEDQWYLEQIKKVDDYMNLEEVPEEICEAYHHGVRGWMCTQSARLSVKEQPEEPRGKPKDKRDSE